jgi:hypothetical protein
MILGWTGGWVEREEDTHTNPAEKGNEDNCNIGDL